MKNKRDSIMLINQNYFFHITSSLAFCCFILYFYFDERCSLNCKLIFQLFFFYEMPCYMLKCSYGEMHNLNKISKTFISMTKKRLVVFQYLEKFGQKTKKKKINLNTKLLIYKTTQQFPSTSFYYKFCSFNSFHPHEEY